MSDAPATPYSNSNVVELPPHIGKKPLGEAGSLNGGGGGGIFDDMTWQAAFTRVDDKVDGNFKWIIGIFGGGFMALLAAFAAGFLILMARADAGNEKVVEKLDAISQQIGAVRTDIAVLKVSGDRKR